MKSPHAVLAVALAGLASTSDAAERKPVFERCAGIVKAGKNDCATSKHTCAGQAARDGDPEEWVYVPKGACNKIVGGQLLENTRIEHGKGTGQS